MTIDFIFLLIFCFLAATNVIGAALTKDVSLARHRYLVGLCFLILAGQIR